METSDARNATRYAGSVVTSSVVLPLAGNYPVLTTLANELLTTAAQRELPELDEKLYFEVFAPSTQSSRRSPARQSNGAR
jgi:hypothetical protein